MEVEEFRSMVAHVRDIEAALGTKERTWTDDERENRRLARRSVTPIRDLPAGERLRAEDLTLLRPGTGIPPKELDAMVGRTLSRPAIAYEPLTWAHLDPSPVKVTPL